MPSGSAYLPLANDSEVLHIQRALREVLVDPAIEWEVAPVLHVTLCYADDIDDRAMAEVARRLHMVQPVRLTASRLGVFDAGEKAALHIALDRGSALTALQGMVYDAFAQVTDQLSPFSLPDDWRPHITLAYVPADVMAPMMSVDLNTVAERLVIGREDYQPIAEITATRHMDEIIAKAFKAIDDDRRLLLVVTSNAYRDREREIVEQKAWEAYVDYVWKDGTFDGETPLLLWHGGEPIGDIIYTDTEGPFLIEVARERPDAVINLAHDGEAPIEAQISDVWDALEEQDDLGASPEFAYIEQDRADSVYEVVLKTETSILPQSAAANVYTFAEVLRRQ
ncbi:MAG TPA: 2'-5' RNA ligase family protein [Kiloniellaceae bacterium]|nr:2'-5' RNA ligase family protein [Kiloniellaceae bacterium]